MEDVLAKDGTDRLHRRLLILFNFIVMLGTMHYTVAGFCSGYVWCIFFLYLDIILLCYIKKSTIKNRHGGELLGVSYMYQQSLLLPYDFRIIIDQ